MEISLCVCVSHGVIQSLVFDDLIVWELHHHSPQPLTLALIITLICFNLVKLQTFYSIHSNCPKFPQS